jgi:DNA-binding winged helix-turn-helix (wHTH) protein
VPGQRSTASVDQEYVVTIAKRGYRFAVPVTEVAGGDAVSGPAKVMLAVLPCGASV